jgi:hypothetical protein
MPRHIRGSITPPTHGQKRRSTTMTATAKPRTLIVCMPSDTTSVVTATAALGEHLEGVPQLATRFHVRHRRIIGWFTRWCTYWLVRATRRKTGSVRFAAGGRLDLSAAATAAYLTAVARWTYWQQVTHGTRAASPWDDFKRRQHSDPKTMPADEARRRFTAQARIQAMEIANAKPNAIHHLDPYEVDAYQAGCHAYATRYQLAALAGDAMLTTTGEFLQPDSESFTDVIAYLKQAAGHIHQLGRRHQLVAMTI